MMVIFALVGALATAQPTDASGGLLARMAVVNAGLRTFTAAMHADVTMKSFPFVELHLEGTYYYERPDKSKVDFQSGVPVVAQQFDRLYARVESPSQWQKVYEVTVVSDNGSTTRFKLVPRKRGNVEHIDAAVDDKAATVSMMRWDYRNGGWAEMHDRYARVGGYTLVTSQTGHVQEPGYVADLRSRIDGYHVNVPLSDDVFSNP